MPADVSKTHRPRSVSIQPVLDAWLRPLYCRNGYISSRKDPLLRVAKVLKREGIVWQNDWLRHSYCSYRLAQTGDPIQTAEEDGHSVEILVRRYLKLVNRAQAEAYFALSPEACGIGDWERRVADYLASHGECHERVKRSRKQKT